MTITELENIVTHLCEEIEQRDAIIQQLQTDLDSIRKDYDAYRNTVSTLVNEVVTTAGKNSQKQVTEDRPPPVLVHSSNRATKRETEVHEANAQG